MLKLIQCNRDETNKPLPDDEAKRIAGRLYDAGAGRTIGMDPEPFIEYLSTVSPAQFDSIVAKYRNRALMKDINSKLGGSFLDAVVASCTDRYSYLAQQVEAATKGMSGDKNAITR